VFSTSAGLSLLEGLIGRRADIANPFATIAVENELRTLLPATAQLYTGNELFFLALDGSPRLLTDAPLVNYDPRVIVDAFNTENSVLRQGLKTSAVQERVQALGLLRVPLVPQGLVGPGLLDLGQLASGAGWMGPTETGEFSIEGGAP
jgi:hypothetical protein